MSAIMPPELEGVASEALQEAGVPAATADATGRLVVAAICQHLMGCRVSFGSDQLRPYRDRAVYEMSRYGNSEHLAVLEHVTARHLRRIVQTVRRRKGV